MTRSNLKNRIIVGLIIAICSAIIVEIFTIGFINKREEGVIIFIVPIIITVVYMLIAGSIIIFILLKLEKANRRIGDQMSIFASMSDIYYSMHLINMSDFTIEKLEGNDLMGKVVSEGNDASDMVDRIIRLTIEEEYIEAALKFADLSTLKERLKNNNYIFTDVVDKNVGWLRVAFIKVEEDKDKEAAKVILVTQVIDENKKREEELSNNAHKDGLTGLFNRRAYENDLLTYPDVPPEQDFIYAVVDINGLKNTNDKYGHAAGDEVIKATAELLKRTFGNYGRVYRTGGDEFVSMFFADDIHLKEIVADLDRLADAWKGELSDKLALSVGYVTKKEYQKETVKDMAAIADKRMYKAKAEYYSRKGVDRRKQAAAYAALGNLYTKILEINLTRDSYSVIIMDPSEQTEEMGFADTISKWLHDFGITGQVHPDDVEAYLKKTDIDYLREYFKQGKTSIDITYRRKYKDVYKLVVMEIVAADDYNNDYQSMYLYVKIVER